MGADGIAAYLTVDRGANIGLVRALKRHTEAPLGPESRRLRRRAAPSLPPGGRFCSGRHPNCGGRGGTIKRFDPPWVRPPEGGCGPVVCFNAGCVGVRTIWFPPGGRSCSVRHPNFGGRGGTIKRFDRTWVRPPEGGRGPRVRRGSRGEPRPTGAGSRGGSRLSCHPRGGGELGSGIGGGSPPARG
jgi:hypothetical protein